MPRRDLSSIEPYDKKSESWRAIVETPKASPHKYDYEPKFDCFCLAKTLPEGMTFPFDFGFIPGTLADDGDPLDILVLLDFPAASGIMVKIRLVGDIRAEQKEKNEPWERNDRLIGVAQHSRSLADIKSLDDLRPGMLDEVAEFFTQYNRLDGKAFRAAGTCDAKEAEAMVRKAIKAFEKDD